MIILGEVAADRGDQAVLGAVVVGDQRLRLAGAGRDLGDGEAGVAVGLHHLDRRLEDPLAGAGGRPSPRLWLPAAVAMRYAWAPASIAGSRPIAASFFESDFAAYSKISLEW